MVYKLISSLFRRYKVLKALGGRGGPSLSLIFLFFFGISWSSLTAQVSNIKFKQAAANEQYVIFYDLEKSQGQQYFEIELVAFIGGIRVTPSRNALVGDVGLSIKTGKRKKIIWNYSIDLEQIIGTIDFKIRARRQFVQPPPTASADLVLGTGLSTAGLATALWGGNILLKKGQIDPTVSPNKNPIIYYYTFCENSSPTFDRTLVRVSETGQSSACDAHFEAANKKFKRGIVTSAIGLAVIAGGVYTLIAKPFLKPKKRDYQKKYYLAVSPTFQWEQIDPANGQAVLGARLVYEFGQ